ncbi:hypothetical protein [Streptomyces arboris]|uniref:hypothetical protein n=1 Tax=Streptomyces arboris TaxID=2600619 RepID=UPI0029902C99|nr:hypothetical protein [Streptomyces arboris]
MSKKPSRHGEEPSRFKGEGQHGWAPDVDETSQQPNPSAHRSFNPDTYAPEPDRPRKKPSEEEKRASLEGTTTESSTSRGEDRGGDSDMHGTGRRGKSRRPSGEKDASAHTGVDRRSGRAATPATEPSGTRKPLTPSGARAAEPSGVRARARPVRPDGPAYMRPDPLRPRS